MAQRLSLHTATMMCLAGLLTACTGPRVDLYPMDARAKAEIVGAYPSPGVAPAAPATVVAPPVQATAQTVPEVRVNRYTTVAAQPTVNEVLPLQAVVRLNYPRKVQTIEQALSYTLMRSGYHLSPSGSLDEMRFRQLPLPESQRILGPYTVERVLQTLIGSEWVLTVNHPARLVSFAKGPSGQGAPEPLIPASSSHFVTGQGQLVSPVAAGR
ncbi:hypothetical protein E9531_14365 [Lampropedia puyangensis]|uniref:Pilus assembly protein PilL n=1 Tax=Lampropedia puyangensis TaxID=1330072 RepID=A0A4V4GQP6_9BURK|nr:hypothetical protein [Lampropedia puyangensis]THT98395.1 hypothetical protein E9531_14365 [Lampropedia puyangensis]